VKRVDELTGSELDYWVARSLGFESSANVPEHLCGTWYAGESDGGVWDWQPSARWSQAGPIIERELITIVASDGYDKDGPLEWSASVGPFSHYIDEALPFGAPYGPEPNSATGPTPLIAAMRAYVASKYGEAVPDEVKP